MRCLGLMWQHERVLQCTLSANAPHPFCIFEGYDYANGGMRIWLSRCDPVGSPDWQDKYLTCTEPRSTRC